MRIYIRHGLVGLFGIFFWVAAQSFAAAPQGYIHEVRGDVRIAVGSAQPVTAEKNRGLVNNATITTGPNSNAVLKFIDGTVIALNENTSFQIQKYEYNAQSPSTMSMLFSMLRGGLRAITGAVSAKNRDAFRLATPTATIGIRGTEFMAQLVNPLYVQVTSGAVSLSNAAGVATFAAGQSATVASSTTLATSITAVPPGTFGTLPGMPVPPAIPAPVPAAASAGSAAAGGISGVAVGAAAAAAAVAAAVAGGGSDTPATGTTGTTGTQ